MGAPGVPYTTYFAYNIGGNYHYIYTLELGQSILRLSIPRLGCGYSNHCLNGQYLDIALLIVIWVPRIIAVTRTLEYIDRRHPIYNMAGLYP